MASAEVASASAEAASAVDPAVEEATAARVARELVKRGSAA